MATPNNTPPPQNDQKCKICGNVLPLSDFYVHPRTRSVRATCRACERLARKKPGTGNWRSTNEWEATFEANGIAEAERPTEYDSGKLPHGGSNKGQTKPSTYKNNSRRQQINELIRRLKKEVNR
jgi:hypothetical protein